MFKRHEQTNTKASLLAHSQDSSDLFPMDSSRHYQPNKNLSTHRFNTKKYKSISVKRLKQNDQLWQNNEKEELKLFRKDNLLKETRFRTQNRKKKSDKSTTFQILNNDDLVNLQKKDKEYCKQYLNNRRNKKQMLQLQNRKPLEKIYSYQIIRPIGKGKFGKVYLAKHKKSGFIGAMKVINKNHLQRLPQDTKNKIIAQMISEIKIQTYLKHSNVIQLYDCFNDEENIYLFLQLATDGQLYQMLQKAGKFSEETTALIVREIAQGLHYIHSKNIIHRDLKLQNIVFIHGMAKICDFGWSVYEPTNFRQTLCGTPIYLSPQLLKGNLYNSKIDVWVLGTITYELISGNNPFGIISSNDLNNIIQKEVWPKVGSPEARSFIDFVLRKNPERRPLAQILLKHPFLTKYRDLQTSEELCQVIKMMQYTLY